MQATVICRTQCTAPNGQTGTFLYDTTHNELVSPVCVDSVALFAWCRANGWIADPAHTGNPYMPNYIKVTR